MASCPGAAVRPGEQDDLASFDERRALNVVALRIDGRNVPQARLNVSGVGTVTLTGTWVPPAQVTNPDGTKSDVPGEHPHRARQQRRHTQ